MKLEGDAAKNFAMAMAKGMTGAAKDYRKSGMDCPECGAELYDSEGGVVHLDPPRKRTKCRKCCYRGWRPLEEKSNADRDREEAGAVSNEDSSTETSD